jgi:deoxyhypusine synthase
MEPTTIAAGGVLINLLLGGVLWFMRNTYADLKEQVKEHKQELDRVKDTYFKKEDFREFKDELWTRLDKMEINWTTQLNELRK